MSNTYWIIRFGVPGRAPLDETRKLLIDYGIRTVDSGTKPLMTSEFWDLVCRDKDGFQTPLEHMLESKRCKVKALKYGIYDQCCCTEPCKKVFSVEDKQTGVIIEPVGTTCITRFSKDGGRQADKLTKDIRLQERIDTEGIHQVAADEKRKICRICTTWLVPKKGKSTSHCICERCLDKGPYIVLNQHIVPKLLNSVTDKKELWEKIYKSQNLPWYIKFYIDCDGDLYMSNTVTGGSSYVDEKYQPRIGYDTSNKVWYWKIKQEVPTNDSDGEESHMEIVEHYGMECLCTICRSTFTSPAMKPNEEALDRGIIKMNPLECTTCRILSPTVVYDMFKTKLLDIYRTDKIKYHTIKNEMLYTGEMCRDCDILLTIKVSKSVNNPGRKMKWCNNCFETTDKGWKEWIDQPNYRIKQPSRSLNLYNKTFPEFEKYIENPTYLSHQMQIYKISESKQNKLRKGFIEH